MGNYYDDYNDGDGLSEMGSQHCGSTITSAPGIMVRGGGAAAAFLAPPPRRPPGSFHGSVGGGSGNGGRHATMNKSKSKNKNGRSVVSPHQETKDTVISDPDDDDDDDDDDDSQVRSHYSRDSYSTRDPEGVYDGDDDDHHHHDDNNHGGTTSATTVEEYAAMARRRASRMTHVNFEDPSRSRDRRHEQVDDQHDGPLAIVGSFPGHESLGTGTSGSRCSTGRSRRSAKRRARVEKSKDDLFHRYDEERTMHHDGEPRRREDSRKNHSFVPVDRDDNERELHLRNGDVDLLDSHPPVGADALAVIPIHAPADEAAGGGRDHDRHPQVPINPSNPQTMVGSHILAPSSDASTSSTVSSITSVDSYMRQQILLKELEKYKKEREWMRREREAGRRMGATTVLVEEDEEEVEEEDEEAFHENGRERKRGASVASRGYDDDRAFFGSSASPSRSPRTRHLGDRHRNDDRHRRARSMTPTRQRRHPDTTLSPSASRSVKSFHSPTNNYHPHRPSWRSHSRSPSRSSGGNRTRDSRSSRGWSSRLGSYISGASENTSYYSDDEESSYYYDRDFHSAASSRDDFGERSGRRRMAASPPRSGKSTSFRSGTQSPLPPPPPPPPRRRSSSTTSSPREPSRRRRRSSSRSTATRSHRSSAKSRTSRESSSHDADHATAATPPVYQLEECCIKHPDVLLSDQTDVRVWTCMRYCKDEKSGRWITVKKVCRVCLHEMEGRGYDDDAGSYGGRDAPEEGSYYAHHHSRHHSRGGGDDRSHPSHLHDSSTSSPWDDYDRRRDHNPHNHDDGTASLTESRYYYDDYDHDDDDDAVIMKDTINVHPTFGEDGNQTPLEREAEAQRRRFIRRLAARAYHFPGNTWCEDWMQYMSNTHLVLGIFFHHPLHPVTGRERCIILLGSVAVGLLMSNLIYLWFVHANIDTDEAVISIGIDSLNVTKLMITLWTLGSVVHTLFDLSVWHIKACTLCRYGGNVSDEAMKCGRTAGVTIVLSTLAFATYLVLLRASSDYNKEMKLQLAAMGDFESDAQEEETANVFFESISLAGGAQSFDFLAGYIIEFILAVFVYNPLILTVVFTGMLGCNGRIPVLGGRPREVAKEQRYAMKRQRYTMPQTLKLGDEEFEADMWGDANQKLATNF